MEIREIVKKIRKSKALFAYFSVAGLIAGILIFTIPAKYLSSGALYINRKIDKSDSFFTYEGYYSQQSAMAYANSVMALAESSDVKKQVLDEMGIPISNENLKKLDRAVVVKKTGPQIITISVKDTDPERSQEIWEKLTKTIVEISKNMNKDGDENLLVSKVSEKPLVNEVFKSAPIFVLAGLLVGFVFGLIFICIKEYFKD